MASTARIQSRSGLAGKEVIELVRRLAKQEHSSALAQLASRISAVARYGGSNGEDVFGKIKGLIRDMIAKLENEANAEAIEKRIAMSRSRRLNTRRASWNLILSR